MIWPRLSVRGDELLGFAALLTDELNQQFPLGIRIALGACLLPDHIFHNENCWLKCCYTRASEMWNWFYHDELRPRRCWNIGDIDHILDAHVRLGCWPRLLITIALLHEQTAQGPKDTKAPVLVNGFTFDSIFWMPTLSLSLMLRSRYHKRARSS